MSYTWIAKIKNDLNEVNFAVPEWNVESLDLTQDFTQIRLGGYRQSGSEEGSSQDFLIARTLLNNIKAQIAFNETIYDGTEDGSLDKFIYGKNGGTGARIIFNRTNASASIYGFDDNFYKYYSFTNYENFNPSIGASVGHGANHYSFVFSYGFLMDSENEKIYPCYFYGNCTWYNSEHTPAYYDSSQLFIYVIHPRNGYVNYWDTFRGSIPSGEGGDSPYEGGGYSTTTEPQDYGEFDEQTEVIAEPTTPVSLAVSSGFLTVYNPTYTQVVELGNYLWTTFDLSSWKKLFANPMDCIIGISIYPFSIPNEDDDYYVMVGNVNTFVRSKKALGQFVTIDCGKLYIKPYSKSYLDYSPFTKIELVLPYVGSFQLDTDIIMGKWIKVVYKCDLLSGACLASVSFSDEENGTYSVIGEYTGKCNIEIPLVSTDFRSMESALLNAVSSFKDYISSNGASGFSPMQNGLANTIANMKPNVNRSGALQSCIGLLGVQKPRIIKTIPRQCVAENQGYMEGYPSFIKANVSELEGFTVFEDIEIKCSGMTEKERQRAIALFKKGVWL